MSRTDQGPDARWLFREPGGFEGLPAVQESAYAYNLACADRLDGGAVGLDHGPALSALCDLVVKDDHVVRPRVDVPLGAHVYSLPDLEVVGERSDNRITPPSDLALIDATDGRVPLDLRIESVESGLDVASQEGFLRAPNDLHVLLRHRPRSISRCQEVSAPCKAR